ncbi:MAG TPA: hypothetical protein VK781_01175 [Solirubrobacteraceae bacterium]|jgi:hypothetical protein|nr:hypothetical protein [Solirubrobacteraceae bacterium]
MGQQPAVSPEQRQAQRAIVLQLLRNDHDESWMREELRSATGLGERVLDAALDRLGEQWLIVSDGEAFLASPPMRYLDALELVSL